MNTPFGVTVVIKMMAFVTNSMIWEYMSCSIQIFLEVWHQVFIKFGHLWMELWIIVSFSSEHINFTVVAQPILINIVVFKNLKLVLQRHFAEFEFFLKNKLETFIKLIILTVNANKFFISFLFYFIKDRLNRVEHKFKISSFKTFQRNSYKNLSPFNAAIALLLHICWENS